jgi:hypothetical protein
MIDEDDDIHVSELIADIFSRKAPLHEDDDEKLPRKNIVELEKKLQRSCELHLINVRVFHITVNDIKYPLVEDIDTGDVFAVVSSVKHLFQNNYSRKMNAAVHRNITVDGIVYHATTSFEASPYVKSLILREEYDNVFKGHMHVIPLITLYHAMSDDILLAHHPIFAVLEPLIATSTYHDVSEDDRKDIRVRLRDECISTGMIDPLFTGPRNWEVSLKKYYSSARTINNGKKRKRMTDGNDAVEAIGILSAKNDRSTTGPLPSAFETTAERLNTLRARVELLETYVQVLLLTSLHMNNINVG